jgi:hypothetical protein
MCFEDQVQCRKNEEQCRGGCSGDVSSTLKYDFATMIAISELNPDVVGEDGYYAAAANCTTKTTVIEVPWFEGGDSFNTFATRMRIRCTLQRLNPFPVTTTNPDVCTCVLPQLE